MDWTRFWLTLGVIAVAAVIGALLYLGWHHRAGRQRGYPDLPAAPDKLGEQLTEPLTGVYVSTTVAGQWQNRIVVHGAGRRAKSTAHLTAAGVLLDRVGEDPIWIPRAALAAVATAPGIAGKVMGLPDGILLITWTWGSDRVDTGFRADDPDRQQVWITAATALLASQSGATA